VPAGQFDTALMDERAQQITSNGDHKDSGRMRAESKGPSCPRARRAHTMERAGTHSPVDCRAAGRSARPSCTISIPRDVNDQPLSDVYPVQAAYRYLRSVMTLRPDHPYPTEGPIGGQKRATTPSAGDV
jgi:hypothetical protein